MTAPSAPGRLEDALKAFLPGAAVSTSTGEYTVDGRNPALVVSPRSQEEVAAVLVAANEARAAVIPWGSGAHMTLGAPPARYDLALDLAALDRVVEYEPADLTVTVEAGVRLSELQRRLSERGQWIALDPPGGATATIGGILAANASGPARVAYGTARDLVIGMTLSTARGELVKSGGRVVKNVAGYDMAKLHIGALGTLGVIVQASFKVAPLPARTLTLTGETRDAEQAFALAFAVRNAALSLTGLAVRAQAGRCALALRLSGSETAVERSLRECREICRDAGVDLGEPAVDTETFWGDLAAATRPDSPSAVLMRLSALPAECRPFATELAGLGAEVVAYPATGVTYGRWAGTRAPAAAVIAGLRERLARGGGALVVEAAPVELKIAFGVWGPTRSDFPLMRRTKEEMDPNVILCPGRFLGGI